MSDDDAVEATILGGRVNTESAILYSHDSEASVSNALAAFADIHGWEVRREVHIPGWGRLDLLLTSPGCCEVVAVEVKLDLTKPAQIRKAFQQADGYYRWLTDGEHDLPTVDRVILTAAKKHDDNVRVVSSMYGGSVQFLALSMLMFYISSGGWPNAVSPAAQVSAMRRRLDALRREVAVREAALDRLLTQRDEDEEAEAMDALTLALDFAEESE